MSRNASVGNKPNETAGSRRKKELPVFISPGIGTRIKQAADRLGTRENAASAASISEDMLYRYIREQSAPSFSAMVGLANAAKVRLLWLATGEGNPEKPGSGAVGEYPGPELALLERVMLVTFEELLRRHIQLEPAAQARLIRVLFRHFSTQQEEPDHAVIGNFIDLAHTVNHRGADE